MSTLMEKTEKKAILLNGKIEYAERIIAALGDPRKWEYRGECLEDETVSSTCACGHTGIRYLFIIHHRDTGAKEILGSTCIKHYVLINEKMAMEMADDYEKLQEKIRLQKLASKKAQDEKEVQSLVVRYEATLKRAKEMFHRCLDNDTRRSRALSRVVHWRPAPDKGSDLIKKYIRHCDMKRKLTQVIGEIDNAIDSQLEIEG